MSTRLTAALTATISAGLRSWKICETNCAPFRQYWGAWVGGYGGTNLRNGGSSEDQASDVGGSLVREDAAVVENSSDSVGLDTGADKGSAVEDSGGGGFLALDELFLRVGMLGTTVGLSEEGGEDGEVRGVVERSAEGNGRGLDRRKIAEIVAIFYLVRMIPSRQWREQKERGSHTTWCLCLWSDGESLVCRRSSPWWRSVGWVGLWGVFVAETEKEREGEDDCGVL